MTRNATPKAGRRSSTAFADLLLCRLGGAQRSLPDRALAAHGLPAARDLAAGALPDLLREQLRVADRPPAVMILAREWQPTAECLALCNALQREGVMVGCLLLGAPAGPLFEVPESDCLIECPAHPAGSPEADAGHAALFARLLLANGEARAERERLVDERAHHKIIQARLEHLTHHDDLTGLHNRRHLQLELEKAARTGQRRRSSLIYIDIDHFKVINDAEGYAAGDQLLRELTALLHRIRPEHGMLARVGSDEFALLVPDIDAETAVGIAEDIRARLDGYRFRFRGTYPVSVSVGVCHHEPDAGEITPESMLGRAYQAAFAAKQTGRNRVYTHAPGEDALHSLRDDRRWIPVLREALAENRFFFAYQPIVELETGTISHHEALIRLRDGHGNIQRPGDFIPAAERVGLINPIDAWVVDHAIDALAASDGPAPPTGLDINLSAHAFQNRALLRLIRDRIHAREVDPARLVLEITETAAIANFQRVREMVTELHELGCRLALDDFGAGFNSFRYLRELPVDLVKLDGSFVRNVARDPADRALVKSMAEVARSLGKRTVAEFVDSPAVLATLRELDIDLVQGNYVGAAQPGLVGHAELPAELARPASGAARGRLEFPKTLA